MTDETSDSKVKSKNPIKNPAEWVEPIKWFSVLFTGIILPLVLLCGFWVVFRPPYNVFLTVTVVYTILIIILISGIIKKNNEVPKE